MRKLLLFAYLLTVLTTQAQTYCTPTFLSTSNAITGFQLDAISMYSGSSTPGYSDYSYQGLATTAALFPGNSYTIFFTGGAGIAPGDYFSIFIDADHSGAFEPDEQLMQYLAPTNNTYISAISVPLDALPGYTRLRVMNSGAETVVDPCDTYIRGEVEDYTVLIESVTNCIPLFGYGSRLGDYIGGLSFGTIADQGAAPGTTPYTNYVNTTADRITSVARGSSSILSITAGPYDPDGTDVEYYSVWIDLNQDGQFVVEERVAMGTTQAPGALLQLPVQIPANAATGYTRMRVLCDFDQEPVSACGVYVAGEARDYTLVISGDAPCIPAFPQPGPNGSVITRVQLADMDWQEPAAGMRWPYLDAADRGAHLTAGSTEQLTLTHGDYPNGDTLYVWIDWNGDGFDVQDLITSSLALSAGETISIPITPPYTVGYVRMRVAGGRGQFTDWSGCGNGPAYGNVIDFTLSIGYTGWPCMPLLGYGTQYGDAIVDVQLQGHTYSGLTAYPYYQASSLIEHRFVPGTTVPLTITTGAYAPETYTVMMDMNHDGDFDDDPEILATAQSTSPGEVLTINVPIPANSSPGQHLLRIRSNDATLPLASPCTDSYYGNTLDLAAVVDTPNGPCIPFAAGWTLTNHYIDGVELGTMANTGSGAFLGPAYTIYSFPPPGLITGLTNTLYLTSGAQPNDNYSAWIDLNADNDFDDADEHLGWVSIPAPFTTAELPFEVPVGTTPGYKQLRVRCATAPLSNACASVFFGETEDYTVYVDVNTGVLAATMADLRLLPTTDGVQLLTDASLIGHSYLLLDATGRTLSTGRITADRTYLPMTDFARGAYTVQVTNGDARQVKRFVW